MTDEVKKKTPETIHNRERTALGKENPCGTVKQWCKEYFSHMLKRLSRANWIMFLMLVTPYKCTLFLSVA